MGRKRDGMLPVIFPRKRLMMVKYILINYTFAVGI